MSFLEILKGIVGIIFFLALMATVAIAITAVIFKITNKLDKKRNRNLTIAFLISFITGILSWIGHFIIAFQLYNM
ncbi:MAG: hypothetical protein IJD31_07585 [Lachnospiraceae bacterium]|nr:hypothetical protein [Lachnospiraceae bacterium]